MTVHDAEVAFKVWGPSIAGLQGKTIRKTPKPVVWEVILIPTEIRGLHHLVEISVDILFVNGIPLFVTLSSNLKVTKVTYLSDCTVESISKEFRSIFKYYLEWGFQITAVMADNELAPLEQHMTELPGAPKLNLTSASKHEPFV